MTANATEEVSDTRRVKIENHRKGEGEEKVKEKEVRIKQTGTEFDI